MIREMACSQVLEEEDTADGDAGAAVSACTTHAASPYAGLYHEGKFPYLVALLTQSEASSWSETGESGHIECGQRT